MIDRSLQTLPAFLEHVVGIRPTATALLDSRGSMSYTDLQQEVWRAANMFASYGIGKGDRVVLLLPNSRESVILWFGLAELGAVQVPVNIRLRGAALTHQLLDCEPELAVVGAGQFDTFCAAAPEGLRTNCLVAAEPAKTGVHSGASLLAAELAGASAERPPSVHIDASDPLVIMYTSGTTGAAKGVVNCHNVYTRIGRDLARLMALTSQDRSYVFMPLYHGNAQMMAVMPTLAAGGSLAIAERFSARNFWTEVRRYGATTFTHIGAPLPILMKQPPHPDDTANTIRLILGGAPPVATRAFEKRFGCVALDGWGMIEAGCNTTISGPGRGGNGAARECFEVAVVDEHDCAVEAGVSGQIVVRPREPDVMFSGYHNAPHRTVEATRNLWFHSGDSGMMDADGVLTYLGRSADAIRHKGENVSPSDVEAVLTSHPDVEEAAVVGIADAIAGQEIKAVVVLREAARLTADELCAWCAHRLADFMVPRYITFTSGLEKSGSDKVLYYKLRDEGISGAWDRRSTRQLIDTEVAR